MSELPPIAGRQVVKALGKIGYELDRQRGSHRKFRRCQIKR
jgi:predicted RNA binding protein YcfA (HicA-like mRNA interferase family)